MTTQFEVDRICLRSPIPEIAIAAQHLDDAVTAHLQGDSSKAGALIAEANMPVIREWVESIWGKASPHRQLRKIDGAPGVLAKELRIEVRMPSTAGKLLLLKRDCFRCRFCGVPVVRAEVRQELHRLYPDALPWGRTNASQHAAFQAMWAQYDHILPHARGGDNDPENVVVTCAPCNFGRMDYTLEEVGLCDPRQREPVQSDWDGLERLLRPHVV